MVEWFYGTTNKSEERKHKEYYPPCDQRCRPLLTAMLGLDIIYRDAEIVVVNKPSGLLSVPGRGPDKQDCVVTRLKRLFPLCIEQPSVHRLDMDTSGLLVLALTQKAHRNLSIQFIQRRVEKEYIALVDGVITEESGKIELAFRYDPENKPRQKYDPVLGKVGITHWQKIRVESYGDGKRLVSRIRFVPITGRTHQLRVHSMHERGLGFPIVGDPLYGRAEGERLMLHASKIAFTHPETTDRMEFISEPEFA
jgi:tRNA pseudouridine32 synthase/23S rRNA pseudouridine746 synthase